MAATLFALALLFTTGLTVGKPSRSSDDEAAVTVEARYRGVSAPGWARRYRHRSWQLRRSLARAHALRRTLLFRPSVREAIELSGATYGQTATLWRKARCETGGTFWPGSRNRSSGASGLFQFLPSTFASTPYARFSIWSPYANALAAGWMHAHGRGGEWACK